MKVRTLMVAQAIVSTVVGLVFTIIPSQMLSTYGITSNIALDYMGQLYGVALLGIGVLAWLAKDSTASEAGKAILTGFFVASAIGFVVSLMKHLNHMLCA